MTIATPIYRAVMLEVERRRLQLGLSMDRLSEVAGLADRAYAKMLYPETASGRQAQWNTLQAVFDVLFADGFDVAIKPRAGAKLDQISSRYKIRFSAGFFNEKTLRELMSEMGKKGGANRMRGLQKPERRALAKRAGIASGRARRKRRAAITVPNQSDASCEDDRQSQSLMA